MQKIFYEKEIDLLHQLKELISLTVDESIDYKIEDHGVRAVGTLAIKGEYVSQEKIYETKEKEEKAEDDEDLGVYYLYVVLPNDTYASIARQYHVDEKMIREYNQDLNLDAGQILIIPYAPKNHSNKV